MFQLCSLNLLGFWTSCGLAVDLALNSGILHRIGLYNSHESMLVFVISAVRCVEVNYLITMHFSMQCRLLNVSHLSSWVASIITAMVEIRSGRQSQARLSFNHACQSLIQQQSSSDRPMVYCLPANSHIVTSSLQAAAIY